MGARRSILQISETGGTSIRRLLAALRVQLSGADLEALPTLLSPTESREPWLADDDVTRSFAVIFRDPDRRYANAFETRLRQGRPDAPAGTRLWTPGEAVAFTWFRQPDALFEALGSTDEAERSAANFALDAVSNLKHDHHWYLGNAEQFTAMRARFWFVRPMSELSDHIDELLPESSEVVHERAREIFARRRASTTPVPPLSARSREMLRLARPEEYALYDSLVAEHGRREAL